MGLTSGCARSSRFGKTDAQADSPAADQKLPFHQNSDRNADDSAHPALPPDRKTGSGTPFRAAAHEHSLPAGTLITVRLENSLFILKAHPGDTFTASLIGPLEINGDPVIERGTLLSGRIESAQPSADRTGLSSDPGYVRLTLNSITIDGKALDIQTSSLFAKGTLEPSTSLNVSSTRGGTDAQFQDLRVQKGRRLTFRLIAPVTFSNPNSIARSPLPELPLAFINSH
jgi:hypothetical protein